MTDFEFLSVLISIVIGLGLTHLLSGMGRAFYFRHTNKMDSAHLAWSIAIFMVLVLNWWVSRHPDHHVPAGYIDLLSTGGEIA